MPVRSVITALCLIVVSFASLHAQSGVIELNDQGWKALQNGNGTRAAALFAQALTYQPNDPVLLLGAGAAAHVLGKNQDAMARLKKAVELQPRLTTASRLLGTLAYQAGEVDLAIRTYEQALKYAPDDAVLAKELAEWRLEFDTHRGFEERRHDRFRVMFEGRAEQTLAAEATAVLDSAFWRICEKLGEYPPDTVIAILYTDKQFRDITRAPEWSNGQYDGRIRIPVAGATKSPELFEQVLTHELTHAVLETIAPGSVPAWLHEGLAQYFEGRDEQDARQRLAGAGRWLPLKYLERGFGSLSASDAQVAYDESLVAVAVILERPGFGWTRLLRALGEGRPPEPILDSFGFSYADLEAGFRR